MVNSVKQEVGEKYSNVAKEFHTIINVLTEKSLDRVCLFPRFSVEIIFGLQLKKNIFRINTFKHSV